MKKKRKAYLPVGTRNRIEGFIDSEEGDRLARFAGGVPFGRCIVELGTASGSGALYLAAGRKLGLGANLAHPDACARVHCFDPYELGDEDQHSADQFRDPAALALLRARAAYLGLADLLCVHEMTSIEGAARWANHAFEPPSVEIGLLHIDARHDFESASADFLAWAPLLPSGAIVVMHDLYGRKVGEVERVVNEVVIPSGGFDEIGRYPWSKSGRRRGQWIGRKI